MSKEKGRLPDYKFHALNKATDAKSKVGAAWVNDDGSIRVVLDHFCVLTGGKDLVLTLFPVDREPRETPVDDRPF